MTFKTPREPILKDIYMPRWPVSREHFQNTLALLQTPLKLETPFKNLAPHPLFRIKPGCPEESGYVFDIFSCDNLRWGFFVCFGAWFFSNKKLLSSANSSCLKHWEIWKKRETGRELKKTFKK